MLITIISLTRNECCTSLLWVVSKVVAELVSLVSLVSGCIVAADWSAGLGCYITGLAGRGWRGRA